MIILSFSKYVKLILFLILRSFFGELARSGSFGFAVGLALSVEAKPNVPLVRLAKIELKKMCDGENKIYRRVGNECRLTRCPFEIWSVCWSPVKMVCLCINVQFLVVCLMAALSSFRLAYNFF